jgi:hypothetical protein
VEGCFGAVYVPFRLAMLSRIPEEGSPVLPMEEVVMDVDEFEVPGPQGPVLTMVALVPPVVPSLVRSMSSQKSVRVIVWVCETMMLDWVKESRTCSC